MMPSKDVALVPPIMNRGNVMELESGESNEQRAQKSVRIPFALWLELKGCVDKGQFPSLNTAASVFIAKGMGKEDVIGQFLELFKIVAIADNFLELEAYLKAIADGVFNENLRTDVGVEFFIKNIKIAGTPVKLQIWALDNDERFRLQRKNYLRGTSGVIFLYDRTKHQSFEHLESYYHDLQISAPGSSCIIVDTHSDVQDQIAVPESEITQLRERLDNSPHVNISLKTGQNLQEPAELLAKILLVKKGYFIEE